MYFIYVLTAKNEIQFSYAILQLFMFSSLANTINNCLLDLSVLVTSLLDSRTMPRLHAIIYKKAVGFMI